MLINKKIIEDFHNQGWVQLNLDLNLNELKRYATKLRIMREKAILKDYKYKRVFWDYIESDNLAAIELPFNKQICDEEIYEFLNHINIGETVNNLMGWDKSFCSLARLFCMNNYNFRGEWHRDFNVYVSNTKKLETLQVAIYVQDQPGFRLLKKEFEEIYFNDSDIEKVFTDYHLPIEFPKESYIEVEGKAGSILLFNPSLYHQGSSYSERLDFHMRFTNKNSAHENHNIVYDQKLNFNLYDFLGVDFDIAKLASDTKIPTDKRFNKLKRLKNTINYNTGILNYIRSLKKRSLMLKIQSHLPLKPDHFANTRFQK